MFIELKLYLWQVHPSVVMQNYNTCIKSGVLKKQFFKKCNGLTTDFGFVWYIII